MAHSKLAFPSEIKQIPLTHRQPRPTSHLALANISGYKGHGWLPIGIEQLLIPRSHLILSTTLL